MLVGEESAGMVCKSLYARSGFVGSAEVSAGPSSGEQIGVSVEKWLYVGGVILK